MLFDHAWRTMAELFPAFIEARFARTWAIMKIPKHERDPKRLRRRRHYPCEPWNGAVSQPKPHRPCKTAPMRMICGLLLVLCSFRVVSAQGSTSRLADSIDSSRTIIAKLDHAAQSDPPPNFQTSILVRQHQDATSFIALADSVSTIVRNGGAPVAHQCFSYTANSLTFSTCTTFLGPLKLAPWN